MSWEIAALNCLFVQECEGLEAGDLKGLAATDIRARELVIATNHVGLGLGELGAVALIGMARELCSFAANDPGDFVVARLAAFGTGEGVGSSLGGFVEEVTFFHILVPRQVKKPRSGKVTAELHEIRPEGLTLAGLIHSNPRESPHAERQFSMS